MEYKPLKFLYCVQTKAGLSSNYEAIFSGRNVLLLSYRNESEKTNIFYPNSTWTTGRNKMFEYIKENNLDYDYYVFCDDDLSFNLDSIKKFEESANLLRNYPILYPRHWGYSTTDIREIPSWEVGQYSGKGMENLNWEYQTVDWFDGACNAFSKESLYKLLPYETTYDNINWHMSQLMMILKANYFYRNKIVQMNKVYIKNTGHSMYPKQHLDKKQLVFTYVEDKIGTHFEMSDGIEIVPDTEAVPEPETKE
tara:strand:- start:1957 stop:2712 length:756 start_codon:yes stop_codon:yes gene_type:complete